MTGLKVKSREELIEMKKNLKSKVDWTQKKLHDIERELQNRDEGKLVFTKYEGR